MSPSEPDSQLSFDFSQVATDPLSLLKPETDPGWIENIMGSWDDLDALQSYKDDLWHDLLNKEQLKSCKEMNSWRLSMERDLRDSIRVVSTRIKELQSRAH